MIIDERTSRRQRVLRVAEMMLTTARTAPKAKGVDIVEAAIVEGEDLQRLSDTLRSMGEERQRPGMLRDAANILQGECVVVIGTRRLTQGLNCSHCGFESCALKPEQVPCAFNLIDTGIAIGSACAMAADCRVDSRVMYSARLAAQHLGILPGCFGVQAIAVSASSKSPFFDRVSLK